MHKYDIGVYEVKIFDHMDRRIRTDVVLASSLKEADRLAVHMVLNEGAHSWVTSRIVRNSKINLPFNCEREINLGRKKVEQSVHIPKLEEYVRSDPLQTDWREGVRHPLHEEEGTPY